MRYSISVILFSKTLKIVYLARYITKVLPYPSNIIKAVFYLRHSTKDLYQKQTLKKWHLAHCYKSAISPDEAREQWYIAWVQGESIGLVTQLPRNRQNNKETHFKRINMVRCLKSAFTKDKNTTKVFAGGRHS